jgi:hypothetical protein
MGSNKILYSEGGGVSYIKYRLENFILVRTGQIVALTLHKVRAELYRMSKKNFSTYNYNKYISVRSASFVSNIFQHGEHIRKQFVTLECDTKPTRCAA